MNARRLAPLAIAALLASGCAAGQVASTSDQKTSIDGVNAQVRHVDLRALSIAPPPAAGVAYPIGSDATIKLVLVNNSSTTDTLTGIRTGAASSWANFADRAAAAKVQQASIDQASGSTPAGSSAEPQPTGTRSVVLAPGNRLSFGTPDARGALLLTGLGARLYPGSSLKMTFTFDKAGSITLDVPVQLGDSPRGPVVGSDSEGE